jgi:hypothetical protein
VRRAAARSLGSALFWTVASRKKTAIPPVLVGYAVIANQVSKGGW